MSDLPLPAAVYPADPGDAPGMHPRIARRRQQVARGTVAALDERMIAHLDQIRHIALVHVGEPERGPVTRALEALQRAIRMTDAFTDEGRMVRRRAKEIAVDVSVVILAHAVARSGDEPAPGYPGGDEPDGDAAAAPSG